MFTTSWGSEVEAISFFARDDQFTRTPLSGERVTLIGSLEKSFFGRAPKLRVRIAELL
jgi:hypothetical protein